MNATGWAYGAFLLASAACMLAVDRRWRLALFRAPRATLGAMAVCVALLLVWDLAGIALGIFERGAGPWQSGWQLAPELPVEELLFLAFLSHLTLVVDAAVGRLQRAGGGAARMVDVVGVAVPVVLLVALGASSSWRGGAAALTYLALDAAFLVPVLVVATLLGRGMVGQRGTGGGRVVAGGGRRPWDARTRATLTVLALLTAVFDTLLIRVGIVAYDWSLTSGLRIGGAPLEDFAYVVLTSVLAPVLAQRFAGFRAAGTRTRAGERTT